MSGGSRATMTSGRAQIARMRRVAVAALDRYALPDGRLTFVTHGENTTFRHDSTAGQRPNQYANSSVSSINRERSGH